MLTLLFTCLIFLAVTSALCASSTITFGPYDQGDNPSGLFVSILEKETLGQERMYLRSLFPEDIGLVTFLHQDPQTIERYAGRIPLSQESIEYAFHERWYGRWKGDGYKALWYAGWYSDWHACLASQSWYPYLMSWNFLRDGYKAVSYQTQRLKKWMAGDTWAKGSVKGAFAVVLDKKLLKDNSFLEFPASEGRPGAAVRQELGAEATRIGFVILGDGEQPGCAEAALILHPQAWNHSYGKRVLALMRDWAWEIARAGKMLQTAQNFGVSTESNPYVCVDPPSLLFGDRQPQILSQVNVTASEDNPASIKLIQEFGFVPFEAHDFPPLPPTHVEPEFFTHETYGNVASFHSRHRGADGCPVRKFYFKHALLTSGH